MQASTNTNLPPPPRAWLLRSLAHDCMLVLRFGSDGGVPLKPPNQYLSLRVILAEKVPIIKGF